VPQLAPSVCVFAHESPHLVCPEAQEHVLAVHDWPVGQALPHIPQLGTLLVTSTQLAPHCVSVAAHVAEHLPSEHTCPAPHAVPHAPQLFASDCGSTQPAPHALSPAKHWHAPFPQV
jgi:hypothetical protein